MAESHAIAPRLDHVLVFASDPPTALRFLTEIVGLTEGARPAFGFPGWWLYASDQAVVHLVPVAPARGPDGGGGAIRHVAFRMSDRDETLRRLRRDGWRFGEALVPQTGELQLFVSISECLHIELVFDPQPFTASIRARQS
jgi:catechol 2,3-dioxygenase-like lactoylglutathione lyase family enzyme